LLALTVLTGVIYPLLVTGVAQLLVPNQAGGSLLRRRRRGSALLGQTFTQPRYFWGRGSLTSPGAYDAAASAGSNLGPLAPGSARGGRGADRGAAGGRPRRGAPVPVDLVTASGSGLDPHISPEAARYQVPRVARARALTEPAVQAIVDRRTEGRTFGLLGEPRVNVLLLNQDLDAAEQ
jgi:K+-transporting ATPase ATPase C chain